MDAASSIRNGQDTNVLVHSSTMSATYDEAIKERDS
jgi:hypothetical protein